MTAAKQLDPALTAEATDAAFAEFLAERPQLVRDGTPLPGLCRCPDRYSVEDRPLLVRHTVCDNTPGTFAWIDLTNEGGPLMRSVDLGALTGWIPVPPPAPALDPGIAVFAIGRMIALGFHLVRLHSGTKRPIGVDWNDPAVTPALTAEEALAHVLAGGNLGVLLGPSNLVVIDAENHTAVQALLAAGLRPVLFTAKGMNPVQCDPRYDKRGGGHVWLRVPEGHRGKRLTNIPQAKVGDGGLIDVLAAPGSMAVVPPTALIAAGGHQYAVDGGHPVWHTEEPADAPEWLFDRTAPCPGGLETMHGGLTARVKENSGPVSESAAELSSELDAVPWSAVLALDPQARLEDWGDEDPECGCPEIHFRGATHRRSGWLHACERGHYAHFVSDTAMAALGLDQRTVSKAQLAAALLKVPATGAGFHAVAQRLGVTLPSPLGGFVEATDRYAEKIEDQLRDGSAPSEYLVPVRHNETVYLTKVTVDREHWIRVAAQCRSAAVTMRGRTPAMPQAGGEVFGLGRVLGAEAETPTPPASDPAEPILPVSDPAEPNTAAAAVPPTAAPGGAQATADSDTGGDADDGDEDGDDDAPRERVLDKVVREYRGTSPVDGQLMRYPMPPVPDHVPAVQGARTEWRKVLPPIANRHTEKHVQHEWIFTATPGLSQVAAAADARAVARWGMLASLLPRVAAKIPATVRLIPSGAELADLPTGPTTQGTAINVYCVAVSPPSSGKTVSLIAASGLMPGVRTLPPGTGEGVLKEFPKVSPDGDDGDVSDGAPAFGAPGEDLSSLLLETDEIDVFVGEMMRQGSKTSGWYRSMWMGGEIGNTASGADRRSFIAAHTYRFGILLGAQPDALAPMFGETGRGTPQRFIWLPAQKSVKRGTYPERLQVAEVHWFNGNPSMIPDTGAPKAPVWVVPPAAAEEALLMDAIAGATANPTEAPSAADPAASIASNHATLNQLKISVLLATLDGLTQPQDVHWYCAGAIMAVRRAMIYDLVEESRKVRREAARVRGEENGLTQHAANAARDAQAGYHVQRCASTIIRALVRDMEQGLEPRTYREAIKALGGRKRRGATHSDQQLYGETALAAVKADERVFDSGTHVHFIGGKAA